MAAVFISSGAPSAAIGSVAWLWSGRVRVRRGAGAVDAAVVLQVDGDRAGDDGAALRRLAGDQDRVRGGGSRQQRGTGDDQERRQDGAPPGEGETIERQRGLPGSASAGVVA